MTITRIKLLIILLFAIGVGFILLTDNSANPHARAYSSGPPAGYTRAPGEEPEACAECHVVTNTGTGTISLIVPQTYTPGQTYNITVTHANPDQTRIRWGFQLTALNPSDEKAGTLEPLDNKTQVLNNQGPFPSRQYIEHTSVGTFLGQLNGASWTFKWKAPDEDMGPVTFYAAGNQANGDGNTSGDNIYFTFAAATYQAPAPDFQMSISPASRTVVQGASATYDVTVTPLNGFTGSVTLSASVLPTGAAANFQPATVNLSSTTPQTSVLTVSTTSSTTTGPNTFNVNAASGALSHTAQAGLNVAAPTDADLAVTQSVSPNPGQVNTDIRYTVNVVNNGPAAAHSVSLLVNMPAGVEPFTSGAGGDLCLFSPGVANTKYICSLGTLAAGQGTTIDFITRRQAPGIFNTTTTVSADEHDPFPSNNLVQLALSVTAQSASPSMTVSNLGVRTVVAGLDQPTSLAFIGADDFFVLEKASGRVVRVRNGVALGAVLDLAVNSASERGLLGIALHPSFNTNHFVYLYWTESTTGQDATAAESVPLLGNRVDRFVWNGSTLTFDRTLLRLRALQADEGQPVRGNHNGGVLRFGPDGKLYVMMGDNGRRGFLQNLPCGPTVTCPTSPLVPDDQYGGPEPDDAHFTGFILRLNDDGTTPTDNPYFNIQTTLGGPVVDNLKRLYAYGVRNGFGMDFDPVGGYLWTQENGDDAFDEINRVEAGFNGGWAQLIGPSSRISEFKSIEVARGNSLQQNRWPPSNLADTPAQALARLYQLPGSHYTEPEFSWKYAVAPSPIGFGGAGLGLQYAGDLFVGASRTTLLGGYLMRFHLSADRKQLTTTDSRLADKVADNADKFDLAESESLVIGRDFGITTDIRTEPSKGNLYVVSLSNGAVYEVYGRSTAYFAHLNGAQETPANSSTANGSATLILDRDEKTALVSLRFGGLATAETAAHIHSPASTGQTAPPSFDLPAGGNFNDFKITLTPQQVSDLKAGLFYINVHSTAFPAGEIRGQFALSAAATSIVQFDIADRNVSETAGVKTVRVVRIGDTTRAAVIDYQTADGTASERSDYTTARGRLRFAAGETTLTFDVLVNDDALHESDETINLSLVPVPGGDASNDRADFLTIIDNDPTNSSVNPIDDTTFFVRQHYHDFLGREPDAPGLQFWTNEIEKCGADAACREVKRINVSAAFFLSIEFQETGYFAHRLYKASFDRRASYVELIQAMHEVGRGVVVGQGSWEAQLAANKLAFVNEWVEQSAFKAQFDALTNFDYVVKLYANAGVQPSTAERDALVAALDSGAKTRARVLLDVVENAAFKTQEFNRAFVLMEYYGYLRRNPNDPPDSDLAGYNFWLAKLNAFNGDYIRAEMVKAFIMSLEYRRRFGP